jgi:hypothetical protein
LGGLIQTSVGAAAGLGWPAEAAPGFVDTPERTKVR